MGLAGESRVCPPRALERRAFPLLPQGSQARVVLRAVHRHQPTNSPTKRTDVPQWATRLYPSASRVVQAPVQAAIPWPLPHSVARLRPLSRAAIPVQILASILKSTVPPRASGSAGLSVRRSTSGCNWRRTIRSPAACYRSVAAKPCPPFRRWYARQEILNAADQCGANWPMPPVGRRPLVLPARETTGMARHVQCQTP